MVHGSLITTATLIVCKENYLDNTDGHGLPHVTDGETTEGREFLEGLDTQGLGRYQVDDGSITRLDGLWLFFSGFACRNKHV